jgi:hypothetical protein
VDDSENFRDLSPALPLDACTLPLHVGLHGDHEATVERLAGEGVGDGVVRPLV